MTVLDEAPGEPTDARGRVAELHEIRAQALAGPSEKATAAQHAKGKLTARERIELLLDAGSFREVEQLRRHRATGFGLEAKRPYTDGVITGWGTVEGRQVFVYAHDFRIFGGALGEAHATKIHKIMDMAISAGAPLVSLNDGAGARIQEGVSALAGYGGIFQRNTKASGVIPQISVMLGPCAGGAAYSPALTDFVFMVRETSQMFITGPDVVKAVTGEEITQNGLGGADVHAETSGVCHFAYDDEETCIAEVRYLLSLLPQNNRENPPRVECTDAADRRGEVLLYAYCNATVPRISLILRKAYGGAYIVMDSQSIGADLTYAWPTNEIAVMGAEGAANVIFRRQTAEAEDPEARRAELVKEYKAELMHPYYAAERGLVDDVIDPAETREVLVRSLAMLHTKHADLPSRKHGNPPQ